MEQRWLLKKAIENVGIMNEDYFLYYESLIGVKSLKRKDMRFM